MEWIFGRMLKIFTKTLGKADAEINLDDTALISRIRNEQEREHVYSFLLQKQSNPLRLPLDNRRIVRFNQIITISYSY